MKEEKYPLPMITEIDRPFWEAANEHKFVMQECINCQELRWPPSPICPSCWSEDYNWTALSGRGKINSWVVFHHSYFEVFDSDIPYTVAEINLEEGPRYIASIIDCDSESLYQGKPVEIEFEDIENQISLPKFRPQ